MPSTALQPRNRPHALRTRSRTRRRSSPMPFADPLGELIDSYRDPDGRRREIRKVLLADRSILVIDRDAAMRTGALLVGRIDPDEERSNCELLARLYLADQRGRRCRALLPADLSPLDEDSRKPAMESVLGEGAGSLATLELRAAPSGLPQLRWVRRGELGELVLSLRELIGSLESYEPARRVTVAAIREHRPGCGYSVSVLRAELDRLDHSPIVLNRGLREAVQRAIRESGLSMSEIASRCGRVKRDRHGNPSGEASWLGRRTGLLPEAGAARPTPWIHTDVLALIARRGLGLSPREVEL